ncbi:putative immunoglobulin-blocking virulence protein [[Mycoplasma] phocae]|uniref:Putative immunoglobulin-blocking virulence protein n=1 Tax=[Mycoplasma] phocae TaxID=142651 RepID=A0A2Z5IPX6_9BACT|nr:putative immunoglobulin-blocking virulence protein [[Mycoplasma] phocae]AXE60524.1 putative immunoglobulin-blocking virulence protein [[Mycoplasma] phocae]
MKFLKKRKNKILLGVVISTAVVSISLGAGLYYLNSDLARNELRSIASPEINIKLINKDNLDIKNASSSINDSNLKEIKTPQKIIPKKDEKIISAPDIKKPETKKEEQKEKPEDKKEKKPSPIIEEIDENKDKTKPSRPSADDLRDTEETYVDFGDIKVKVRIKKPGRKIDPKYINLANREEYLNNIVGKIVYVEVTQELIDKNRSNVQGAFKSALHQVTLNDFKTYSEGDIKAVIRQNKNTGYFINLFEKYKRLFDNGDKVVDFLTEEGKRKYPIEIKQKYIDTVDRLNKEIESKKKEFDEFTKKKPQERDPKTGEYTEEFNKYSKEFEKFDTDIIELKNQIQDAKDYKYSQLIANLDFDRFKNVAPSIDADLSKGYVINTDEQNVYVDENGNLNSFASSPLLNQTTSRNERDNSQKRAFGIPGYFGRSSYLIDEGNYPGWNKADVTLSPDFQFLNINSSDGIKIEKLTKDLRSKLDTKRNEGYVVTIDASNSSGYSKTLNLIKQLKEKGKEITSYRIKNIGLRDNNQEFLDIFKELPEKLPQLEVFFEGPNTSALLALESKKIDELGIYTSGNSLAEHWSINPYALKNVAWFNNLDYNVSWDYNKYEKITTRITFDSISFDQSDYSADLKRINDGLKIAYWIRNNEPVFQGGLGPGLDPDNNEKGNSYPTGLDLTRVKSMKSLKGLQFKREDNDPEDSKRRLKRIGLYNSGPIFSIDVDDLNDGQFDILDTNPFSQPRSKIYFSNGSETTRINVTNNKKIRLSSSGKTNLKTLLNYSDNFGSNTKIEIDMKDSNLVSDLSEFTTSESNGIVIA